MKTRSSLRHPKPLAPPPPPPQSSAAANPSDCAIRIARIAVAQVSQSVGFKSAEVPALETLTRVAALYLKTLAKAAASYSNDCNRTQLNVFDAINALHDLESAHGFTGASDLHSCCLLRSSLLKDAGRFVNTVDEIPFAKPIPRANCSKSSSLAPGSGVQVRGKHIPEWLPDFPEESTYTKEGFEGYAKGGAGELALWERSVSGGGEGEGVSGTTWERTAGELRMERERVKFQIRKREERTVMAKKRKQWNDDDIEKTK